MYFIVVSYLPRDARICLNIKYNVPKWNGSSALSPSVPLVLPCSQDPPLVKHPSTRRFQTQKWSYWYFPAMCETLFILQGRVCLFVASPSAVFALLQSLLPEASPQRTQICSCWEVACVEQQYDIYWARGSAACCVAKYALTTLVKIDFCSNFNCVPGRLLWSEA